MADDELERLRQLVGPSEVEYQTLKADVVRAREVAKRAVLDAGALRGQLQEMSVRLERAQQDQDALLAHVALLRPAKISQVDRVRNRWRRSIQPRLRLAALSVRKRLWNR